MAWKKQARLAAALAVGLALGGAAVPGVVVPFGTAAVAEATSDVVDPSLRPVDIYAKTYIYEAWGDETLAFHQTWPELFLPEGTGPAGGTAALAAGLRRCNDDQYQNIMSAQDRGREAALQAMFQTPAIFRTYHDDRDLVLRRADSLAVSYIVTRDDYTGGRYEFNAWYGVNVDTATGRRLMLSDVFADKDELAAEIISRLKQEYLDVPFEDMEASVTRLVAEDKINWTLAPRGASFYLNPFEAARLAAGILTTTICFDEAPDLFKDAYRHGPAAYCESIPVNSQTVISLRDDGDGRHDKLLVFTRESGEKGMAGLDRKWLNIILNDSRYEDPEPAAVIAPVHVRRQGGRNFLCVDCANAVTGERELRVYDLDGAAPRFVGKLPKTFDHTVREGGVHYRQRWLMTDPERFRINDNDIGWNENARTHTVGIDDDGRICFG